MATKLLAWHFSTSDRLCRFDGREIVAGKTLAVEPPLSRCYHGLHASVNILDACNYAPGSYIWRVELSGEVIKGDDKAAIEAKTEALMTASQKLGEKMYAAEQAKAQAAGGADAGAQHAGGQKPHDDNVVDAEFTEVKDKK